MLGKVRVYVISNDSTSTFIRKMVGTSLSSTASLRLRGSRLGFTYVWNYGRFLSLEGLPKKQKQKTGGKKRETYRP